MKYPHFKSAIIMQYWWTSNTRLTF